MTVSAGFFTLTCLCRVCVCSVVLSHIFGRLSIFFSCPVACSLNTDETRPPGSYRRGAADFHFSCFIFASIYLPLCVRSSLIFFYREKRIQAVRFSSLRLISRRWLRTHGPVSFFSLSTGKFEKCFTPLEEFELTSSSVFSALLPRMVGRAGRNGGPFPCEFDRKTLFFTPGVVVVFECRGGWGLGAAPKKKHQVIVVSAALEGAVHCSRQVETGGR